jgi:hypothetical protein
MTAVEFLESEMQKVVYIAKSNKVKFDELIKLALEMEEDEKHESYLYGHKVGFTKAKEMMKEQDEHLQKAIEITNEYYNTIFKQQDK